VVKPQQLVSASDERKEYLILSELAGAEVCAWAKVKTPAVGLARFPKEVDERALRASLAALEDAVLIEEVVEIYRINRDKLAFCSRHIPNATDVLPETFGTAWARKALRRSGGSLFVVDFFVRLGSELVRINHHVSAFMNSCASVVDTSSRPCWISNPS
jgi:hypothetical protein